MIKNGINSVYYTSGYTHWRMCGVIEINYI